MAGKQHLRNCLRVGKIKLDQDLGYVFLHSPFAGKTLKTGAKQGGGEHTGSQQYPLRAFSYRAQPCEGLRRVPAGVSPGLEVIAVVATQAVPENLARLLTPL